MPESFFLYESDRVSDVPLKARKAMYSCRDETLHYLPSSPAPGVIQSLEWPGQLLIFPGRKYHLREVAKFIHACMIYSADMQLGLLFAQHSARCCVTSLSYFCSLSDGAKIWNGKPAVAERLCDVKEDLSLLYASIYFLQ